MAEIDGRLFREAPSGDALRRWQGHWSLLRAAGSWPSTAFL